MIVRPSSASSPVHYPRTTTSLPCDGKRWCRNEHRYTVARASRQARAMSKKSRRENRGAGGNNKKKIPASNRKVTRAALEKTPRKRGTAVETRSDAGDDVATRTPNTPKIASGGVKKPRSSTKKDASSTKKRTTPRKPLNTTTYIMNQRKYGPQPKTPRPLSSMKSPRLESLAVATTKPPESGLDMFGSMIGALSPKVTDTDAKQRSLNDSSEVIKLCSIISEQAEKIAQLEAELKDVRAQLQARAVAPVPTLRRVPSTTSALVSRITELFQREK